MTQTTRTPGNQKIVMKKWNVSFRGIVAGKGGERVNRDYEGLVKGLIRLCFTISSIINQTPLYYWKHEKLTHGIVKTTTKRAQLNRGINSQQNHWPQLFQCIHLHRLIINHFLTMRKIYEGTLYPSKLVIMKKFQEYLKLQTSVLCFHKVLKINNFSQQKLKLQSKTKQELHQWLHSILICQGHFQLCLPNSIQTCFLSSSSPRHYNSPPI